MTRFVSVALVPMALSLLLGGCFSSRRVLRFEDHSEKKITSLETYKMSTFLLLCPKGEHEFWLCEDKGDVLDCSKKCGGDTGLECPGWAASLGGSGNTR
jgi:hypothetical protein